MRTKARLLIMGLALDLALTIAASAGPATSVSLTQGDSGRTVDLAPNGALIITLSAIPGSGFGWRIAQGSPKVLKVVENGVFRQVPHPSGMVGAPKNQVFRFVALGSGDADVVLDYSRPWEKKPPARTFRVHVHVTAAPR